MLEWHDVRHDDIRFRCEQLCTSMVQPGSFFARLLGLAAACAEGRSASVHVWGCQHAPGLSVAASARRHHPRTPLLVRDDRQGTRRSPRHSSWRARLIDARRAYRLSLVLPGCQARLAMPPLRARSSSAEITAASSHRRSECSELRAMPLRRCGAATLDSSKSRLRVVINVEHKDSSKPSASSSPSTFIPSAEERPHSPAYD
jgi:hypothetical protein